MPRMNTIYERRNTEKDPFSDVEMKKDLSTEQREEVIRALKLRFGNNMNRHEGLKNCGLSVKWKEQAMSRMLLAMIKNGRIHFL